MGSNNIKPIWFFHIPKTSGRFFYANSIRIVEQEMIISGKQYNDVLNGYGHLSFKPIDDSNIISFATLRNPVARTISHWQHIYRNYLTDNFEFDKKKLFDFLEQNPYSGIINYQTKFIAYNGSSYMIDIDEHQLPLTITQESLDLVKTRINKIDYLFRSEEMSHKITEFSLNIMRKELGLEQKPYFRTTIHNVRNPNSKKMYSMLTDFEKRKIESYLKHDMDLYESSIYSYGKDLILK